jgi:hypothetical protein
VSRQTLTSATFEIFKVERLRLPAVNTLWPEPAERFNHDLAPHG